MLKRIFTAVFLLLIANPIQSNKVDFIDVNNKFAFNILQVLPQNQNNFYSPLSITYSLYMLLNGANGLTESELKNILNIQQNETLNSINEDVKQILSSIEDKNIDEVVIRFANRILTTNRVNLSESFENTIRDHFNSSVDSVDFFRDAVNITENINDWIRQQTNGKIDRLFETLSNDTLLVISNALYLSAIWEYPFDSYSTHEDTFYTSNGFDGIIPKKVDMMRHLRKFKYIRNPSLNASMIELPFIAQSNLSMIIVLPNERNGLNETIKNLNSDHLNIELKRLHNKGQTQLDLSIPKFELQTEYNLKNALKALGLKSVFDENADLSGITGYRNIRVSEAIHKAVFKVTESGAEASAAVGIVGVPHIWIPPVEVKVDRPFLFLIQDIRSGLVLFLGQVLEI